MTRTVTRTGLWALGAALASGCAAPAYTSSAGRTSTAVSGGMPEEYRVRRITPSTVQGYGATQTGAIAPGSAQLSPPAPSYLRVGTEAATAGAPTVASDSSTRLRDDGDEAADFRTRMASFEDVLMQDEQQLSTAGNDCRVVCRATQGICTSAEQICVILAQQGPSDDDRCARARTACSRAQQYRVSTCPMCPANL